MFKYTNETKYKLFNLKNILICTIVRNRSIYLSNWIAQLNSLIDNCKNYKFFLSVYENDSVDDSDRILKSLDYSKFLDIFIKSEVLNTNFYGSIKHDERVRLLADARNVSIYKSNFLNYCDEVLFVEPDIHYNPISLSNLVKDHAHDILSCKSCYKQPDVLYDKWATRINANEEWWNESLQINNSKLDVWSTFNCFCKYKSEPFKNGICFSGFNKRLNKYDCDTAVICENFREHGYNNIVMDSNYLVFHG